MVGLSIQYLFYSIGTSDFFSSFFYTIHFHLENGEWGDTYPHILKELYIGEVKNENLSAIENELKEVKNRLRDFKPSQIIWDINDINKRPPWNDDISLSITDLSNYFVTSDGRDLFDVIFRAIDEAKNLKSGIKVRNAFLKPSAS